jgi:hypothetical protein
MAPPPQRIVWLYKRWQPLYDEISRTVVPRVEFVRGIPMDLDGDHYFDPRIRNVIVLDDLMSTAAKDPRINDLFTEGSHHCILSVVTLNHNLFFGKDHTQRRNCHYLVLFSLTNWALHVGGLPSTITSSYKLLTVFYGNEADKKRDRP